MSVGDAILVCLTDGPLSGYDLARRFDTSIGFFWRADHQQIYRELRRLKDAGHVEDEYVVQTGRPNKRLWTLTGAGRAHLMEWSRDASRPPSIKDDMMVRLYALAHVDRDALAAQIRERLGTHTEQLALYERILAARYSALDGADADQVGKHLGLQLGLRYESGWIAWCTDALAALSRLDKPAP